MQLGFTWPSLQKDVHHLCKIGYECQEKSDTKLTLEPQFPILSYGNFDEWGTNAIISLPQAQSWNLYIIMGVDYMIGWVEAKATTSVMAKKVAKLVFESCQLSTPLEILLGRDSSFRGDLGGEIMENLGITHHHSTRYYPQCNFLVEEVNEKICKIITKQQAKRLG